MHVQLPDQLFLVYPEVRRNTDPGERPLGMCLLRLGLGAAGLFVGRLLIHAGVPVATLLPRPKDTAGTVPLVFGPCVGPWLLEQMW